MTTDALLAAGSLRVGDEVRVVAGENKGRRGTVTHLYPSGVFAGLVVIDDRIVAESIDVRGLERKSRGSRGDGMSQARARGSR